MKTKFLALALIAFAVPTFSDTVDKNGVAHDCIVSGEVADWATTYCVTKNTAEAVQSCLAKESVVPTGLSECAHKKNLQQKYCAHPATKSLSALEKDDICIKGKSVKKK